MQVLKEVVMFMTQYPEAYVLCMGDFNMWLDPTLDLHGMSAQTQIMGTGTLKNLLKK